MSVEDMGFVERTLLRRSDYITFQKYGLGIPIFYALAPRQTEEWFAGQNNLILLRPMQNRRELEKLYQNYNNASHPDANFNPARNKAVIEETIREATKYHQKVHGVLDEALGERIDAFSHYATYRFNKGTKKP